MNKSQLNRNRSIETTDMLSTSTQTRSITIPKKLNTPPRKIFTPEQLKEFNRRCDRQGLKQLVIHLSITIGSGYLWSNAENLSIKIPALIIYGFSLATMFAPVHECSHGTAFANDRLNKVVGWLAGVLSFYNFTFYRYYHKWHHKYTQIAGRDPELEDLKPGNLPEYILEITGFNWWIGKIKTHYRIARGRLDNCPYILETARQDVINSTRLQLGVYAIFLIVSILFQQPWFFTLWLLPLAVGQPFLRTIVLAEHWGCSDDDNPLTNTRTTLTILPIRLLMWNMPFHAEHHLYPSIPFHRLADAHQDLQSYFTVIDRGYFDVHRQMATFKTIED